MEDIKTAVNEEDRIFVLFKEKIRIPEGQWFPAGKVDWGIPKNANGDIVLKYYSLNRKASYTSPSMFSEKLPGVHQISIRDFESLIQTNDYFDNLAKRVLTRETTPVTMQSFLLIKNWIESFIEDPTEKHSGVYLHHVDTEGFIQFRSGRRKAYLPAGIAARTILVFGNKYFSLPEARKLIKNHKKEERTFDRN